LWQVRDTVRQQVSFVRGNLLDPALLAGRERYDVIFCRNLLIYFDRATQDRAVAGLNRLLAEEGLLFVGPSETGLLLSHGFDSVKVPLAFAFRRAPSREAASTTAPVAKVRQRVLSPQRRATPRAVAAARPGTRVGAASPAIPATPPPGSPIEEIVRLADQGHLAAAAARCTAFLRTNSRSTKALYLLGVVRDAAGQHEEAAELFRKVVYLDPDHHEALMHLAYVLERQGDTAGAKLLTTRARRAAERRAKGAA
jgi:chemotaxis protein methyltransferase WspC